MMTAISPRDASLAPGDGWAMKNLDLRSGSFDRRLLHIDCAARTEKARHIPLYTRAMTFVTSLLTPGHRIVDEIECVASVLLAIVLGHLADVENISWAA